jgi:hypothetical protein
MSADFIKQQFKISNTLIRSMERDHVERMYTVVELEKKLAEKDRRIDKLQATVDALRILHGEKP